MTKTEQDKILAAVLNDEITFSKAAKALNVSNEKLEELIDNYVPVPSFETIIKVSEFEKKSIAHINEVIRKHTPARNLRNIECKFTIKSTPIKAFDSLPETFRSIYPSGSPMWENRHTIQSFEIESKGLLAMYKTPATTAHSMKLHQTQEGMTFQFQEVIKQCS